MEIDRYISLEVYIAKHINLYGNVYILLSIIQQLRGWLHGEISARAGISARAEISPCNQPLSLSPLCMIIKKVRSYTYCTCG